MATRYQTGTATSPTDLLQQLVTWLVSGGWTQDMSQADGSGWRAHLHLGSYYINLRACMNETIWPVIGGYQGGYGIGLYAGTGFNSSNGWASQAGGPIVSGGSATVGASSMFMSTISITGYFFFDDGAGNINVVVERAPGNFTYFGWGNLIKAGSYTGGAFFYGATAGGTQSYQSGRAGEYDQPYTANCPLGDGCAAAGGSVGAFVRADVDSFTGKWIGIQYDNTTNYQGYTGKFGASSIPGSTSESHQTANVPHFYNLKDRLTSSQNLQANMLPAHLFAARDAGGWSLLGTAPNVFKTSAVGDGYAAKDEVQIGANTYKLFPNFAVLKS